MRLLRRAYWRLLAVVPSIHSTGGHAGHLQQTADSLAAKGQCRQARRILDVGCGSGAVLSLLRPDHAGLVGMDLSIALLRSGKKMFPAISFVQADCGRLPFRRGTFDVILNNAVSMYFDKGDIPILLREFTACSTGHGRIVIGQNLRADRANAFFDWSGFDTRLVNWPMILVKKFMIKCGFLTPFTREELLEMPPDGWIGDVTPSVAPMDPYVGDASHWDLVIRPLTSGNR